MVWRFKSLRNKSCRRISSRNRILVGALHFCAFTRSSRTNDWYWTFNKKMDANSDTTFVAAHVRNLFSNSYRSKIMLWHHAFLPNINWTIYCQEFSLNGRCFDDNWKTSPTAIKHIKQESPTNCWAFFSILYSLSLLKELIYCLSFQLFQTRYQVCIID